MKFIYDTIKIEAKYNKKRKEKQEMLQNNDIKEKLKYKNFDERALNYIVNAIEEFDSLFGQYIRKEKIGRAHV